MNSKAVSSLEKLIIVFFEIQLMRNDMDCESARYFHFNELRELLRQEIFLNNQIERIRFNIDKCFDELANLARTINMKMFDDWDITSLLVHESKNSEFAAEMAANHFDFFSMGKFINYHL